MATLSEESLANALKGKRKRAGKAPKTLLCDPFPKYWPRVKDEDVKNVESILDVLLVNERGKPKIPWKKLIKMTKDARKEWMMEMYSSKPISEELQRQRKYLKVGLNVVARSIQQKSISSCLLAGDVSSDLLIAHLVTMAATRGIPILIIPTLKDCTLKTLGFSSAALGITVEGEGQYFKSLDELIKKLSSQFPVPFHYAKISKKIDEERKPIKPSNVKPDRRTVLSATKGQKGTSSRDTTVVGFSIDVNPGLSHEKIIYETKMEEGTEGGNEFIPLNSAERKKQIEISSNQLYEDYMSNLLYIAPNFGRMQKNCNRQSEKRMLGI